MLKRKTFCILMIIAMLCLAAGCAKDKPAKETSEAEDYKVLQRPGVELSFDSKSPDGAYSTFSASIIIEADGDTWVLPLTQDEYEYIRNQSFPGTILDHLQQQFGEYKIEEGVITIDPFAP